MQAQGVSEQTEEKVVTAVLVDPQSEAVVLLGELVALVARQAVNEGPTRAAWPGLTFYRFEQRVATHWVPRTCERSPTGCCARNSASGCWRALLVRITAM